MRQVIIIILALLFGNQCFCQDIKPNEIEVKYKFASQGETKKLKFICLVPNDINKIQKVSNINYSIQPSNIFIENGNKYAEFIFKNVSKEFELIVNFNVETYKRDLKISKKDPIRNHYSPDEYLSEEKYIESPDSSIIRIANILKDTDSLKTVKYIYNYLEQNIEYSGFNSGEVGALTTLKTKKGDCTEYSDLFVALCRSIGYKARIIEGYMTEFDNTPLHSWNEVYIHKYGWIRIDSTPGNAISSSKLKNIYVQLSSVRNDSILSNHHHWSYRYWGDPVNVNANVKIID